jgi:molybdopterin-guanine dinucleotide biosynthesis protein B/molybdopterin-guanine dinucleotide biosynthesis protein
MQNSHNETQRDVTGVLLAGGASTRMGRDKANLVLDELPLYVRVQRALAAVCGKLLIAGDRPDLVSSACPVFADSFPGSSLGGLHTALKNADSDWVLVLPCDLPYPSPRLLHSLLAQRGPDIDAVVPRHPQGSEPLIACYRRTVLPIVEEQLMAGNLRLTALLDRLRVAWLEPDQLPPGWRRALRNLNTVEDFAALCEPPPAVTFIARSGTGKTTLVEKVISELVRRGWTIGGLKHDAHRFEIDHEGKDTWKMTRAGATVTAICSPAKQAVIRQHELEPPVEELIAREFGGVDLVITEGFKHSSLPKIEVHRAALGMPLLSRGDLHDPLLQAVVSDESLDLDVPCFDLNDPYRLVDFLEERFLL